MTSVRPADPGDAAQLTNLATGALSALGSLRGGGALISDPLVAAAMDADSAAQRGVWAAFDGDAVVGAATGWIDGDVGWFALWVRPDARGQGRGLRLAELAIGWLRTNGARHIDSVSLPGDRASKQLLEKLGFKTRLLVMREGG